MYISASIANYMASELPQRRNYKMMCSSQQHSTPLVHMTDRLLLYNAKEREKKALENGFVLIALIYITI